MQDTNPGVLEIGAAPQHMPVNNVFFLGGKLVVNSGCPFKFGNPGVKGGLGQHRRAEFPKGKGVAGSRAAAYGSVLEGRLGKGLSRKLTCL